MTVDFQGKRRAPDGGAFPFKWLTLAALLLAPSPARAAGTNDIAQVFRDFNATFPFRKWIEGIDAIREMCEGRCPDWRQTEWPGWYVEFRLSRYLGERGVTNVVFCKNKVRDGNLDFDLWFTSPDFYGDLKASDVTKDVSPGNDQEVFREALRRHGRFWYVIFEHETVKDSASERKFSDARRKFIAERDGVEPPRSDKKNHRDLKCRVRFTGMEIVEITSENSAALLKTFNQGRQPDGSPRRKKFLVRKRLPAGYEKWRVLRYEP